MPYTCHMNISPRTVRIYENDRVKLTVWGLIVWLDQGHTECDPMVIAQKIISSERFDYENLHGAFKMCILDKKTNETYLVTDNSGSQMFFIDKQLMRISDSFLALVKFRGDRTPNYRAIASLLQYEGLMTDETPVEGIEITCADSVRIVRGDEIEKISKGLSPLWQEKKESLSGIMEVLCSNLKNEDTCAVITGGTDSRTVLSHLIEIGKKPALYLSGSDDNTDIPPAKKIADLLHLQLKIYNPSVKEESWIEKGIEFSDGIADAVNGYRLRHFAQMAADDNKLFEFGGVGGEFYKNVYCRFIRNGYRFRRMTAEMAMSAVFYDRAFPWYGEETKKASQELAVHFRRICEDLNHGKLLGRMNGIGFYRLSRVCSTVANNFAPYCTKIDPLMDRSVVRSIAHDNPWSHCLFYWQRKEVTRACPQIAMVATDRGYNCSGRFFHFVRDVPRRLIESGVNFYHNKVRNKLSRKDVRNRWNQDYLDAGKTELGQKCFDACKKIGVIKANISMEAIPERHWGRIITIGSIFSDDALDAIRHN